MKEAAGVREQMNGQLVQSPEGSLRHSILIALE